MQLKVRLTGVQETLLIPLAARVLESRRPDSSWTDPEAEHIAGRIDADLAFFGNDWKNVEVVVGRTVILDRGVRAWLAKHPGGQVFNLGAGLCTRFHRIDDGVVRWTDVDLEDVIALKRSLVCEGPRYRMVAASALGSDWCPAPGSGPLLVIAEGLLMYLTEAEVVALLSMLVRRYPGAHMWLEAHSPLMLRIGARSASIRATGATFRWGLRDSGDLERLVPGLQVLGEEHPNQVHPERWGWLRMLKHVRAIHTGLKCVHVRLGSESGTD